MRIGEIRRFGPILALIVASGLCGCRPTPPEASREEPGRQGPGQSPRRAAASGPSSIRFRDVSAETGIDFVYSGGNDAGKFFPATLGSGLAMLDYDGDGKLDLYFACARNLPLSANDRSMGAKLYRNLGNLRFEDVTEKAKVGHHGYCHGVAVGDVDGDGRPDLFLTGYARNVLYRNNGDGTFSDITASSGLDTGLWSTGAAFLDYDNDGKLDVYVSCYGKWTDTEAHEYCGDERRKVRIFCSPYAIPPQRHFLYKGRGDGTFQETTEKAGVLRHDGRGLGVITADVNGDGLTDIYVANDGCPNFLFLNRGDGTFDDITQSSGASVDGSGAVQGSMGADVQDVDGDARPELFVTNFRGQYNTLYQNLDGRNFLDASARANIVKDSLPYVGWGWPLADLDNDGRPDMFVVNGEVDENLREFGQEIDYDQPTVAWKNMGKGRFLRVENIGPYFEKNHPGRGAVFGDLDNDGDLDVVVQRMEQKPAVLVNESPGGHWVRFQLGGTRGNREAIGATIEVHAGGQVFQRMIKGGDSYLSTNDRRVLIGLGKIDRIDRVSILWPGGIRSEHGSPELGKTHRIVEPSGVEDE